MNFHQLIEQHWNQPKLWLKVLLYPLSLIFAIIVAIRGLLYRSGCLKTEKVSVPVVIVGNIHAGGSGKTPVVIALANALKMRNINVGIISRGYGRETKDVRLVNANDSAKLVGDEPLLIARRTNLPIAVGRKRVQAAKLLLQNFPQTQIILSDDGLQHYSMARDFEIIVFPANRINKKHYLFPNGNLREPISRIKSANMLLFSGCPDDNICKQTYFPETGKVFSSHIVADYFYPLNNPQTRLTADFFKHKQTIALAAIARPERFFNTLKDLGISLQEEISLPDHANLSKTNIPSQYQAVIITEKDAVKLSEYQLSNVFVLSINASLPSQLIDEVLQCLSK